MKAPNGLAPEAYASLDLNCDPDQRAEYLNAWYADGTPNRWTLNGKDGLIFFSIVGEAFCGFGQQRQIATDTCTSCACSSCPQYCSSGLAVDPCAYPDNSGCPYGLWPSADPSGNCCTSTPWSPILFDVAGSGFELTSGEDGVSFDLNADGKKEQIAWTRAGSQNAWLTLDRNANGIIDDGRELFGNFSPQPKSPEPNGFLALAELDRVENGGNANGAIDTDDGSFSRLKLWQDINHNGIAEPAELKFLQTAGVAAINLRYHESKWQDAYGNRFRYRSTVDNSKDTNITKWIVDVFLLRVQ